MRAFRLFFAAIGLAVLTACSTGLQVQTDYDPGYNFAAATRFAVTPPAVAASGAAVQGNDILKGRVVDAIENSLRARGYQIVEPGQADMHVSFFITTEDKTDIRTYNTGYSYHGCYRAGCGFYAPYGAGQEVDVRQYTQGTMFIDFVDPKTRKLEWRGSTSKKVGQSKNMQERIETINNVVNAVLSEFPPGMAE